MRTSLALAVCVGISISAGNLKIETAAANSSFKRIWKKVHEQNKEAFKKGDTAKSRASMKNIYEGLKRDWLNALNDRPHYYRASAPVTNGVMRAARERAQISGADDYGLLKAAEEEFLAKEAALNANTYIPKNAKTYFGIDEYLVRKFNTGKYRFNGPVRVPVVAPVAAENQADRAAGNSKLGLLIGGLLAGGILASVGYVGCGEIDRETCPTNMNHKD